MIQAYRTSMGGSMELVRDGALVVGTLAPERRIIEERNMRGEFVTPVTVHLMIDTGAATSVIEVGAVAPLELEPIRYQHLASVAHAATLRPVYRAELSLGFENGAPRVIPLPISFAAVPKTFDGSAFQGLIGRDFLRSFDLIYAGPEGRFELRRRTYD